MSKRSPEQQAELDKFKFLAPKNGFLHYVNNDLQIQIIKVKESDGEVIVDLMSFLDEFTQHEDQFKIELLEFMISATKLKLTEEQIIDYISKTYKRET